MFELLSKIVADANKELIDKLKEIAPLIIIGAIWLFSAIAKAVSGAKKGEQPRPQQPKAVQRQPGFDNLIKIVRQKYTEAQEQIRNESEQGADWVKPPVQPVRPEMVSPRPEYKPAMAPHRPAPKPYQAPPTPLKEKIKKPIVEQPATGKPTEPVHVAEIHPYLAELADQFTDPDGLRKAFLIYEILGKPLALRD